MRKYLTILFFSIFLTLFFYSFCLAAVNKNKVIILATTTSTQDSGLLDVLIPLFEKKTGYFVKTIAVGSGQAIALGRRGEADVLLVHSPEDEEMFMKEGNGIIRKKVMHNKFIIVGDGEDRAKIKGEISALEAFKKIAQTKSLFISRGDGSGTHKMEQKLWKTLKINPEMEKWYQQTGLGMGQTLTVADEKKAYTLVDVATFMMLKKHLKLEVMVDNDKALWNEYHVIAVNPYKFKEVNLEGANAFIDFITSKDTQKIIKNFGIKERGYSLFIPDADSTK